MLGVRPSDTRPTDRPTVVIMVANNVAADDDERFYCSTTPNDAAGHARNSRCSICRPLYRPSSVVGRPCVCVCVCVCVCALVYRGSAVCLCLVVHWLGSSTSDERSYVRSPAVPLYIGYNSPDEVVRTHRLCHGHQAVNFLAPCRLRGGDAMRRGM